MDTFSSETFKPILTEPGVKYFINDKLKRCHNFKEKHQNNIYNICLFILFLVIFALLLLYKYKGKLTPEEMKQNEIIKKQYILSKIKNFQDDKLRAQQSLITGLPHYENEFDIINDTIQNKLGK